MRKSRHITGKSIFILLIIIVGFFIKNNLFSVSYPSHSPYPFVQYVGRFHTQYSKDRWYFDRTPEERPTLSNKINILNYEIVTQKHNGGWSWKCKPPPSNRPYKKTYIDDDGCQHFQLEDVDVEETVCKRKDSRLIRRCRICSKAVEPTIGYLKMNTARWLTGIFVAVKG